MTQGKLQFYTGELAGRLQERRALPDLYLVAAVDPGDESGWAVTTMGLKPIRVASGFLRKVEADPMRIYARVHPLLAAVEGHEWVVCIEDMPPGFFKHHNAASGFTRSRSRWSDALYASGKLALPPHDMHLAAWRKVTAMYGRADALPRLVTMQRGQFGTREEKRSLDYKGAAKAWCLDVLGYETRNSNEAEALAMAWAFARQLALGEVVLGSCPAPKPRTAPARGAKRTRG